MLALVPVMFVRLVLVLVVVVLVAMLAAVLALVMPLRCCCRHRQCWKWWVVTVSAAALSRSSTHTNARSPLLSTPSLPPIPQVRQLAVASTSFALCLSSHAGDDDLYMEHCSVVPEQQFDYDKSTGHLKLQNKCVQVEHAKGEHAQHSPYRVFLAQCSFAKQVTQEWRFRE